MYSCIGQDSREENTVYYICNTGHLLTVKVPLINPWQQPDSVKMIQFPFFLTHRQTFSGPLSLIPNDLTLQWCETGVSSEFRQETTINSLWLAFKRGLGRNRSGQGKTIIKCEWFIHLMEGFTQPTAQSPNLLLWDNQAVRSVCKGLKMDVQTYTVMALSDFGDEWRCKALHEALVVSSVIANHNMIYRKLILRAMVVLKVVL